MKKQLYVIEQLSHLIHPFQRLGRFIKGYPKYECRIGKVKTKLKVTDEALLIMQQQARKQIPFKKIESTILQEKMWEIRVKIKAGHKIYRFDFPSVKKATQFYEQIIFQKIKAHS